MVRVFTDIEQEIRALGRSDTGLSQNLRASTTPQQTMTQFEVFANPVARARASYPFIVMLQADVARGGRERAVAPVAPRAAFPVLAGRLTPIIAIEGDEFVLLVTSVTTTPVQSERREYEQQP